MASSWSQLRSTLRYIGVTAATCLVGALGSSLACEAKDDVGPLEETDASSGTSDELEGCPTHLLTESVASLAQRSFGWNGAGHGAVPVSGLPASYELFDCDADCRRCRLKGPVPNPEEVNTDNRRCVANYPQGCEVDADCGGEDKCRFFFGAPSQSESAWSSSYIEALTPEEMVEQGVEFADGIQGVFDFLTGQLDFTVLKTEVVVGVGVSTSCVGDVTADDGLKEGLCEGTQVPCDVNAQSVFATLSFDCDFTPVALGFGFPIAKMSTAGDRWVLDDSRPMCTRSGEEDRHCWCGVCADDERSACLSDSDCPGSTCGNSGTDTSPIIVGQDACADGETCIWDEASLLGSCLDNGGDEVSCFPTVGEFNVKGTTSVQDGFYVSSMAVLSCIPKIDTPETFFDAQFGFPGPLVQRISLRLTPQYR